MVFFFVVLLVVAAIVILARRNLRLGRGDVRAATRLAAATALFCFVPWLIGGHHVASFWEGAVGLEALAWSALYAIMIALGYLAVEPTMRRRRPQALVSWTRLIGGEVRDPLVGRDILIGTFAGCFAIAVFSGTLMFSGTALVESRVGLQALNGANVLLADLLCIPPRAIFDVFMPLMIFLLMRAMVRKDILAAVVLGGIYVGGMSMAGGNLTLPAIAEAVFVLFVLLRFGFLALAAMNAAEAVLLMAPSLWPMQQWHTGLTLIAAAVIALVAGYGFVTSLAGRPLFTGELIEA
jgi:serine/threonine-protein kinase